MLLVGCQSAYQSLFDTWWGVGTTSLKKQSFKYIDIFVLLLKSHLGRKQLPTGSLFTQ